MTTQTTPHPRIQEVLSVLDDTRNSLVNAVSAFPQALHRTRPGEDRWSVAEVLEHLTIVEGRIAQMLTENIEKARKAGLGQETDASAVAPMLDINTVIDRSKPITASEASQPRAGLSAEEGLRLLAERRNGLRSVVTSADGLALGSVEIPHPRLGTLNVYPVAPLSGGP